MRVSQDTAGHLWYPGTGQDTCVWISRGIAGHLWVSQDRGGHSYVTCVAGMTSYSRHLFSITCIFVLGERLPTAELEPVM